MFHVYWRVNAKEFYLLLYLIASRIILLHSKIWQQKLYTTYVYVSVSNITVNSSYSENKSRNPIYTENKLKGFLVCRWYYYGYTDPQQALYSLFLCVFVHYCVMGNKLLCVQYVTDTCAWGEFTCKKSNLSKMFS